MLYNSSHSIAYCACQCDLTKILCDSVGRYISPLPRCGIAWMFPIHEDALAAGISKPLLFINSHLEFQWQENVQKMLRLSREPDENGISTCQVLTM